MGSSGREGARTVFRFADLDTPFFLASNPFEGGYAIEGGLISVAHITAGHGVTPRPPDIAPSRGLSSIG